MKTKCLVNSYTFEKCVEITKDSNNKRSMKILSQELRDTLSNVGIPVPYNLRTEEMKKNKKTYIRLDALEQDPDFFIRLFKDIFWKKILTTESYFWKSSENYKGAEEEKRLDTEETKEALAFFKAVGDEASAKKISISKARENIFQKENKENSESIVKKMEDLRIRPKVSKTPSKLYPNSKQQTPITFPKKKEELLSSPSTRLNNKA